MDIIDLAVYFSTVAIHQVRAECKMALCVHLGLKLRNYSLGSSAAISNTKFNYNLFIYSDDVTYWLHTGQFETPPSRLHCTCTLKPRIWNLVKVCLYLLVFCTLELRF
jgi:hypothetical protein